MLSEILYRLQKAEKKEGLTNRKLPELHMHKMFLQKD